MLQAESKVLIIDNTICSLVKMLARSRSQAMLFGTMIRASIQKIRSSKVRSKRLQAFKKGQLCKTLLLTVRCPIRRLDLVFRASENSSCLVASDGSPFATRVRGVLFREIPQKNVKWKRLLSICEFIS